MEKLIAYLMLPALVMFFISMRKYHRTAAVSAAVLTTGTVLLLDIDLMAHNFAIAVFDLFTAVLFSVMFVGQNREVAKNRRAALREK